jgi:hypothetical protein
MLVVYICSGCCGSAGCMSPLWPRVLVVYMYMCICMLVVFICSRCCGITGCMSPLWPWVLVVYMFPQLLVCPHQYADTH